MAATPAVPAAAGVVLPLLTRLSDLLTIADRERLRGDLAEIARQRRAAADWFAMQVMP